MGDVAIRPVPLPTDETPAACGKYLTSPIVQPFVGRWNMPRVLFDLISMTRLLQILRGEANDDEQDLASDAKRRRWATCMA